MKKLLILLCIVYITACSNTSGEDDHSSLPGPQDVQITPNDKALVLQWTKLAPAQGVYPSYNVYYSDSASVSTAHFWENVPTNDSRLITSTIDKDWNDNDLENLTNYYVWITADYGNVGKSELKGDPLSYAMPMPVPEDITGFKITPSEKMLELHWILEKKRNNGNNVLVDDPNGVTIPYNFNVAYTSGSNSDSTPPATATQITASENGIIIPQLENDKTYTVWVQPSNSSCTPENMPEYVFDTKSPAAAAAAPTDAPNDLVADAGANKLILTWTQVVGVPQYSIYYNTSADSSTARPFSGNPIPASAPTVSTELTRLANSYTYYVWVKSNNTKGKSGYSNMASGVPQAKPAIDFTNTKFVLGTAAAQFIFAQDLPPSAFFPDGRPNTDRITRVQEAALANLFTDGAAWYVRNKEGKTVDFAFLNGGYIDNVLNKGTITVGTVMSLVDSGSRNDKLVLVTLTGAELKNFFGEVAYAAIHSGRGGPPQTAYFGQVSKEIQYTLEYADPPDSMISDNPPYGNFDNPPDSKKDTYDKWYEVCTQGRIKDDGQTPFSTLQIYKDNTWQKIDNNATYYMVTTDYNTSADFYQTLTKDYVTSIDPLDGELLWHAVAAYIYDQGTVTPLLGDGSSPSARRIQIEGGVPLPSSTGWIKSGVDAVQWINNEWDNQETVGTDTATRSAVFRSTSGRFLDEH